MENAIWTEKYRPSTFEDIKGNPEIVKRIRAFVEKQNLPHLLFSGPAGIGKTTISLVIAKQMYKDSWKTNVLELNASDERGIDIIRVKVKDFARTKALGNVPFKIIYMDESDALTKEAQQALRRTMENYTKTCRFILSCNYSSKIIDPIQSRCAIFRFKLLPKEDVINIAKKIGDAESLTISDSALEALYEVSGGDCRRMENVLQSCASLTKNITEDTVYSLSSQARPKEVQNVIKLALDGDFEKSRSELLNLMLEYGLSGLDVIKQIQSEIAKMDINGRTKVKLLDHCGEVEFRMVEGSDEFIQLESFIAFIILANISDN
jgi:replication factor C small subunit